MKVILLINAPAPYRIPFFNLLNKKMLKMNYSFLVVFDSISEPNRDWRFDIKNIDFPFCYAKGFTIPFSRKRDDLGFIDTRYFQLRFVFFYLLMNRPDIVITCEFGLRTIQSIFYCWLFKKKIIVWSEGTLHTEGYVKGIKKHLRRFIVKFTDIFWTNGTKSEELLESYGSNISSHIVGITGVDTSFFYENTIKQLNNRTLLRKDFFLDGCAFLFVGAFTPRKGIMQTIKVLKSLYNNGFRQWSAIFIGSGQLENELLALKSQLTCIKINIVGSVSNETLPKYFAMSDVFLLPTLDDNWPLSPLEAISGGLPIITSIYNGGAYDLVRSSECGIIMDPLNLKEFELSLIHYIENPPQRVSRQALSDICSYYSPERSSQRAVDSIVTLSNRA